MRCGEPIWQTRSTWPMSIPSSSEAVATRALSAPVLSRCFGSEPPFLGQASVVSRHRVLAQPLAEMARDALGQPPGVDEHERRPVFANQCGQAIVVLLPHLMRHDGIER